MLSLFELIAALLTLTATFAWINRRFVGLPDTIGLLVMGLLASLAVLGLEVLFPATNLFTTVARELREIDFYEAVMHGMLALLLFAGALHVDIERLWRRAPVIGTLATVGVALSTVIIAVGVWLVAPLLGLAIPFVWALVLGTVIAPTDPVAVLSTLRSVQIPKSLETDISGEALFNDGIAVVLFTVAVQATSGPGLDAGAVARLLGLEAGGGAALGLGAGFLAYRAFRAIDDYSTEVLISLALVTGTYALADALGMSGPIAVVIAGVIIGNRGAAEAMSDTTRRYVFGFWTLTDDILNSVLFLLIGLEILLLDGGPGLAWIGLVAVPLTLAARFAAVRLPVAVLSRWQRFAPGTVAVLTWGGVRGGVSVALALSLPDTPARAPILAATYAVVLFSVIAQGLSLGWVARKTAATAPLRPDQAGSAASTTAPAARNARDSA